MTFLEKDLEQIVFEADNELLKERGLYLFGKKYRQLQIGNYGIADIVTFCRREYIKYIDLYEVTITVYELKKNLVTVDALSQACRYVKGIQSYLEKRGFIKDNVKVEYEIVLVGMDVSNAPILYMPDIFPNLSIYTYSYELDGIYFKDVTGYHLINEGF